MKKLILFIIFFVSSFFVHAATHVVDSLNNAGYGSLRAAVDSASSGDTIRFNPNLIANGSDSLVLISRISFSKSLIIKGLYTNQDTLYISGGSSTGILGILNVNKLVLDSLVIVNCASLSGLSGAVAAITSDSIWVLNSVFRNNISVNGGALDILSSRTDINLKIKNSRFENNQTHTYGGGAISCQIHSANGAITWPRNLNVEIRHSVIKNNSSPDYGGGVFVSAYGDSVICNFSIINSTINSNNSSWGGGVSCDGSATLNMWLDKCSFINNIGQPSSMSYAVGGGVFFRTFNSGHGNLQVNRTTFVGNGGNSCYGGAICIDSDTTTQLTVKNSTFFKNRALSGGAIQATSDVKVGSLLNIGSCIIVDNGVLNISNPTTWSTGVPATSLGYNIFSDTLSWVDTTDQVNQDSTTINLGTLAFNGGVTPTMIPLIPSVAIDNGNPLDLSEAQNVPIKGVRDVGAAEYCSPTINIDTIIACDSYTWINGITYFGSDTSSIFVTTNISGCDSINYLKLKILSSSHSVDTITTCNNYTWRDGITYYASNNTAQHIIPNSVGCDSIITLNLTITNSIVETYEVCDSFTWRNGMTYTQSNNIAQDTVVVSGGCDSIFILDLTINHTEYSTDVRTACDSLKWRNGETYYTSNTSATDTLVNRYGCDSIVTLDLTILNSVNTIDSVSACMFYQWSNGQIYVVDNNTATQTFVGVNGCDSTVTLNLEVHVGTFATDTHVVCDSLVWIDGNTYYSNNTTAIYNMVGGNSNGCDSVVTLNLTVNGSHNVDAIMSCDSYTWIDGITYTTSNSTATYTTLNSLGCDSVVTLDLTINSATYGTATIAACGSYTWNGITYTSNNNMAQDTLQNALGCDSIVTLDLTILNSTVATDVISSCSAITWIDGNTYTTNNHTATHILVNAQGCDSIVTLDFTLLPTSSSTDVISSCEPIIWLDGNAYDQSTNGPTYVLSNHHGCDSVVTLAFTLLEADTAVSRNHLTLTAQATNATYQWIDCVNGVITGATSANFTATQNGNYQVEITQNGCVDTSACFVIANVGIQESDLTGISIYPNPTSDVLHIDKGSNVTLEIKMTNSAGTIVYQSSAQNQITTIPMSKMASGVYVVTLQNEQGLKVERVVKR